MQVSNKRGVASVSATAFHKVVCAGLCAGLFATALHVPATARAQATASDNVPTPGPVDTVQAKSQSTRGLYVIDTGLYVEAKPGMYLSLGGNKGISEPMPYIGFDIAYDVLFNLSVGLNLAFAGSKGNPRLSDQAQYDIAQNAGYTDAGAIRAFGALDETGAVADGSASLAVADFTVGMVNAFAQYRFDVADRIAIPLAVQLGVAFIAPINDNNRNVVDPKKVAGPQAIQQQNKQRAVNEIYAQDPLGSAAASPAFNAGIATGIHYYTRMRHFNIGLEVAGNFIVGPNIPGLSVYPVIRYTF